MAQARSAKQLAEVSEFVRWLYVRSGAATWTEFAGDARVHPVSLSDWQNGKVCPDGYNLLRLIRAAGVLNDPTVTEGPSDRQRAEQGLATLERIRKQLDALEGRLQSDQGDH